MKCCDVAFRPKFVKVVHVAAAKMFWPAPQERLAPVADPALGQFAVNVAHQGDAVVIGQAHVHVIPQQPVRTLERDERQVLGVAMGIRAADLRVADRGDGAAANGPDRRVDGVDIVVDDRVSAQRNVVAPDQPPQAAFDRFALGRIGHPVGVARLADRGHGPQPAQAAVPNALRRPRC